MSAELFQPVGQEPSLTSRVADQIEGLIMDRHLKPGDRLPSENELAQRFGVSRTVVREAVRALVGRGLLQVRRGSGTEIAIPTVESVARAMTRSMTLFLRTGRPEIDYEKVHEVRRLLEVEIAGLAAERRTERDVMKLREILDEATDTWTDRARFARNDVAFHAALAAATGNELFALLLDSVADIMIEVRRLGFDVAGGPARGLRHHRAILERVEAADREGARRAMVEHLLEAERTMREAYARPPAPADVSPRASAGAESHETGL